MTLSPANVQELSQALAGAASRKEKVESVDLARLDRVLEHSPEDMTVSVQTGITLAALQEHLAQNGQWLPIDPAFSDRLTLNEIIKDNLTGPRRFGYGTMRDFVIGLTAVLADGTVIHSGGRVVKNVAGYDLMKLFIGGQDTLGIVVEAVFKLRPLPELEQFVQTSCPTLEQADQLIEKIMQSPLTPVVLDLHKLSADKKDFAVVLGFAGSREEVAWQLELAAPMGFTQPSSLDYQAAFESNIRQRKKLSVLPSKMIEAIRGLGNGAFVARAGNGVVYHYGAAASLPSDLPLDLMKRVKDAYDPGHILPELTL